MKKQQDWYTRPVLFVTNMTKALKFYCDKLGFQQVWDYEANNQVIVAQVSRGKKCEVILCEDSDKAGKSRLFIELLPEELKLLKDEIKRKKIPSKSTHWGMPVIEIKDPSGNELYFPVGQYKPVVREC